MLNHRYVRSWMLLSCFVVPSVQAEDAATGAITVEVQGARSDAGMVRCALYNKEDGFPTKENKAVDRSEGAIKEKKATCSFSAKPAGTYAVAVLHDENNNGKLDTNFLGIPKEGVGATNDAKGRMGPPSYKDAAFKHDGQDKTLRVNLAY